MWILAEHLKQEGLREGLLIARVVGAEGSDDFDGVVEAAAVHVVDPCGGLGEIVHEAGHEVSNIGDLPQHVFVDEAIGALAARHGWERHEFERIGGGSLYLAGKRLGLF